MNTLTFNEVNFNPVEQNGQIWLTSIDLAKALGYKSTKSVSNLYSNNSDEFTDQMTLVIDSMTNGIGGSKRKMQVRIFSLRGCHAIGFFARTTVAKAFRKWVLDILDKETSSTSIERTSLRQACDKLAVGNMLISDAYKIVTNCYDVEHIDQIPISLLPEAVAFVYEMILARQKPVKVMGEDEVMNNLMWKDIGFAETEEVFLITQELSSLLARVSLKVLEVKNAHSTIFDSFDGQTHKGLSQSQVSCVRARTQAFVNRK